MSRLPTPGEDDNIWGEILNDFLSKAHKPDGTLKDDAVTSASIPDSTITSAKLADGTITNADINNSAGLDLSKLATDPLARTNHTGTQTMSTISDAGTASTMNTDADGALAADSDSLISTQKAVKAYADTKQPLDSDLTTIAGLTATTDNFMVAASSAWDSRTPVQAKTSLGLENVDNTSDTTKNAATVTLTNKRVTRRVVTVTQSATPAINTNNTDVASITGLAQGITSMTTNLTGTPVDGDLLMVRFTDNGTARAIAWGASFEASTIALPTTTVISTMLVVGFMWNTTTTKWRCIAVA